MRSAVTVPAQRNQVQIAVVAGSTPRSDVMDIEILAPPTSLASPAIALKDFPPHPIVR
jgi:hypothetical protein